MNKQYMKGRQASLGELMGEEASEGHKKFTMEDLPEMLGEKMPELSFDRVGKIRLLNALQKRYGMEFMNLPGIKDILKQFDSEIEYHSILKSKRSK